MLFHFEEFDVVVVVVEATRHTGEFLAINGAKTVDKIRVADMSDIGQSFVGDALAKVAKCGSFGSIHPCGKVAISRLNVDIVASATILFPEWCDGKSEVMFVDVVAFFESAGIAVNAEQTVTGCEGSVVFVLDTCLVYDGLTQVTDTGENFLVEWFDSGKVCSGILFSDGIKKGESGGVEGHRNGGDYEITRLQVLFYSDMVVILQSILYHKNVFCLVLEWGMSIMRKIKNNKI